MADIRLSKLTKQFSIGLARLVDFLNEKGANVEMNPNAKVSDEYLPAIEAKFGEDLKLKKDSEKVTIKLKEIIEMGSKKKTTSEEEEAIEREVVIKSNALNTEAPKAHPVAEAKPAEPEHAPAVEEAPAEVKTEAFGPKVVDKIDLSQFEKKKSPAPAPVPETKPEPVKEEEKPVAITVEDKHVEEPVKEEQPAPAPTPAEEPARTAEPRHKPLEVE